MLPEKVSFAILAFYQRIWLLRRSHLTHLTQILSQCGLCCLISVNSKIRVRAEARQEPSRHLAARGTSCAEYDLDAFI